MHILYAYIICAVCICFTARLLQPSHPFSSPSASMEAGRSCASFALLITSVLLWIILCKSPFVHFAVLFLSLQTSHLLFFLLNLPQALHFTLPCAICSPSPYYLLFLLLIFHHIKGTGALKKRELVVMCRELYLVTEIAPD